MKFKITSVLLLIAAFCISHQSVYSQLTTYGYTGAVQYYTVPAGVTAVRIDAVGAGGGSGDGGPGGDGADYILIDEKCKKLQLTARLK